MLKSSTNTKKTMKFLVKSKRSFLERTPQKADHNHKQSKKQQTRLSNYLMITTTFTYDKLLPTGSPCSVQWNGIRIIVIIEDSDVLLCVCI